MVTFNPFIDLRYDIQNIQILHSLKTAARTGMQSH